MKEGKYKTRIRTYNPNRFNALDAGLVFIVALAFFEGVRYVITLESLPVIGWLKAIYRYDTYLYLIVNILISQSEIFLVAFVYSRIRRTNPFNGGGYRAGGDIIHVLMSVAMIMGIMMVFYYVHDEFNYDVGTLLGKSGGGIEENKSPFYVFFALLYMFLSAFLPAIFEEMLFRGIIMRGLEQFGKCFAVICSALMFALMHGNTQQLVLQFLGGVAIGGVVMITGNWLLGSVMHFVNNIFAVLFAALITRTDDSAYTFYMTSAASAVTIVIGIFFIITAFLYFGSMVMTAVKKEASGEKMPSRVKPKFYYYAYDDVGEVTAAESVEKAPLTGRGEDKRMFLIEGRYSRLNARSNSALSIVCISAGILLGTVLIFI